MALYAHHVRVAPVYRASPCQSGWIVIKAADLRPPKTHQHFQGPKRECRAAPVR